MCYISAGAAGRGGEGASKFYSIFIFVLITTCVQIVIVSKIHKVSSFKILISSLLTMWHLCLIFAVSAIDEVTETTE